jgi:hypothetical protein
VYFPPEELAEKSIEEYKRQKKTIEMGQLMTYSHIEKLWAMNLKVLERVNLFYGFKCSLARMTCLKY